jgi:carbamoyl-phosphate synthase small subunit
MIKKAILALEDGSIFKGIAFGAEASACGEVCFNTSMTGYQEILTDPSYKAQIVVMTYPQIGNYGVNQFDVESWKPHVSGFAIRELSPITSNWRAEQSLDEYLKYHKIPGIWGIDTRAITKKLRVSGAMKGFISTQDISEAQALKEAQNWNGLIGVDYVKDVTFGKTFEWDPNNSISPDFKLVKGKNLDSDPRLLREPLPPAEIPIVAYDFGIKYNILRRLRQEGFKITVVPAYTSPEEVLAFKPAGVFLSNGPGDPSAVVYAIKSVRKLVNIGIPIFGICLGHQIIALALGAKTFKLKFGHRGANQPVQNIETGKIEITSQNHGFAVDPNSLPPELVINRINLNDKTVEGLRHKNKPLFSVQYHPEASPGPHDSTFLFKEFKNLILSKN